MRWNDDGEGNTMAGLEQCQDCAECEKCAACGHGAGCESESAPFVSESPERRVAR